MKLALVGLLLCGCVDMGIYGHPAGTPYRFVKAGATDEQRSADFQGCTDEITKTWTTNLPQLRIECMERRGYRMDSYAGPANR